MTKNYNFEKFSKDLYDSMGDSGIELNRSNSFRQEIGENKELQEFYKKVIFNFHLGLRATGEKITLDEIVENVQPYVEKFWSNPNSRWLDL